MILSVVVWWKTFIPFTILLYFFFPYILFKSHDAENFYLNCSRVTCTWKLSKLTEFQNPVRKIKSHPINKIWSVEMQWRIIFKMLCRRNTEILMFFIKELFRLHSSLNLQKHPHFTHNAERGKGTIQLAEWITPSLKVTLDRSKKMFLYPGYARLSLQKQKNLVVIHCTFIIKRSHIDGAKWCYHQDGYNCELVMDPVCIRTLLAF